MNDEQEIEFFISIFGGVFRGLADTFGVHDQGFEPSDVSIKGLHEDGITVLPSVVIDSLFEAYQEVGLIEQREDNLYYFTDYGLSLHNYYDRLMNEFGGI